MTDLALALRQLADRAETLEDADLAGELEKLRFKLWQGAASPATPPGPSRALDVEAVMQRTGMSKGWLYREARAGRLPFARRIGRRITFDEAALARWLDRRPR